MRRNFYIFCCIFFLSQFVLADLAHRNLPAFQSQRLQLSLEAQSFESNANFIGDGSKEKLLSGFKFITYDIILSSMYDLSDEWAISADLGLGYAESFDNTDYRNSRQIKDLRLGLWRLYDTDKFGQFILDGFYLLNFIENDLNKDEVSVSDGVSWLQAGVWWQQKRNPRASSKNQGSYSSVSPHKSTIRAYLGFRSRMGLSDVLIYKIHPQFSYKKKFVYGAELNGMITVIRQNDQDKIASEFLNQSYNASNFRYNAWNPSVLEGLIWAGYRHKPFSQIRGGISRILGQKNTAEGFGFFLEWQTSMTITPSGLLFSDFFGTSDKVNPRRNNMEIRNYGPAPKEEPKIKPTDLQDL